MKSRATTPAITTASACGMGAFAMMRWRAAMAVEMHPFCSSSSSAGLWMLPPLLPPLRCLQEKVPALWKDLRRAWA